MNAVESLVDARAVIEQHSRSFALAARLLPAAVRSDGRLLYAWCRHADDAVDVGARPLAQLERLERELEAVYAGLPGRDALNRAFAELVERRRIPWRYPSELLAGLRMDLQQHRYQTLDELMLYCYRVAGVVGLMMCHVLGVRDEQALPRAAHLGMGMQLTNICRDVAEDWQRGRLYLPLELLGPGAGAADPAAGAAMPFAVRERVPAAVRELLGVAGAYYRSGYEGVPALQWRCGFAVRTAGHVYQGIAEALARQHHDPWRGRAFVRRREKLRLTFAALVHSLRLPRRGEPRSPARELPFGPELLLPGVYPPAVRHGQVR